MFTDKGGQPTKSSRDKESYYGMNPSPIDGAEVTVLSQTLTMAPYNKRLCVAMATLSGTLSSLNCVHLGRQFFSAK